MGDYLKLTSTLSGGMKKRVNVAMELVTDPLLVILDEPTSGLDTKTTTELLTLLKKFAEGPKGGKAKRIVLAVLHQPSYETAQLFTAILGVQGKEIYIVDPGDTALDRSKAGDEMPVDREKIPKEGDKMLVGTVKIPPQT